MSSVQSGFATTARMTTKFMAVITPCYMDTDLGNLTPIPFTVTNQTLDIAITNSSVQNLVNDGDLPQDQSHFQAKLMGGKKLITQLGPTLVTYLRNLINRNDVLGAPYAGELLLYINPVMMKIQLAQPNQVSALHEGATYGFDDYPPTSDQYVGGNTINKYYSSWVFYSPLTVRYVSPSSVTGYRYLTFTSEFTEEA